MNFYIPAVTHNFSYSKKFLSRLRFLNAKKNQPIKVSIHDISKCGRRSTGAQVEEAWQREQMGVSSRNALGKINFT